MRFTIPENPNQTFPYYVLKVQGGTDVNIAFDIVANEYPTSVRRYCNKQLVHECAPTAAEAPLELVRAEFLATPDPCYRFFNVYKTSEDTVDLDPTIILEPTEDSGDDPDLISSVVVQFLKTETCCMPLRQLYRLYGYFDDDSRILLSHGNLYITPCTGSGAIDPITLGDCGPNCWTDLEW